MGQRLGQSPQDDVALALAGEGVKLLDELAGGDVALLTLVTASEQRIELLSLQVIDLLLLDGVLDLLFLDDTFFQVIKRANDVYDVVMALAQDLSCRFLAHLEHLRGKSGR